MPRRAILLCVLALLLISLPYLFAWAWAGPERVFGGFLLNPLDGYSYQAKMLQGWQGGWLFHLPFAAEPGQGVALNFLFYLFLGHLARWSGLPLLLVFHLARLLGAATLLGSLWRFFRLTSPPGADLNLRFGLAALGLGMGWLTFLFGHIPSDFWVAETYPLLSMYANPHFPLSLALMLWLIVPGPAAPRSTAAAALFSLGLSILSPFGVVMSGLILAAWLAWELATIWRQAGLRSALTFKADAARRLLARLLAVGVGGLPILLYYQWTVATHPVLAIWNAQNQTLTPPAWDVLLALSPALMLAGWAVYRWWASRATDPAHGRFPWEARVLLVWLAVGLGCIYLPVSLQRRFMLGLFVPAVGLAGYALDGLREARPALARRLARLAVGLSLPSLLLLLLIHLFGVFSRAPEYYLDRAEVQALDWIAANTPAEALILAGPQTGLYIPARTGRRVIYGHPYETPQAEAEKAAVEQFFTAGQMSAPAAQDFLNRRRVDFVFYGPRERALGPLPPGLSLQLAFQAGEVSIYRWGQP